VKGKGIRDQTKKARRGRKRVSDDAYLESSFAEMEEMQSLLDNANAMGWSFQQKKW